MSSTTTLSDQECPIRVRELSRLFPDRVHLGRLQRGYNRKALTFDSRRGIRTPLAITGRHPRDVELRRPLFVVWSEREDRGRTKGHWCQRRPCSSSRVKRGA